MILQGTAQDGSIIPVQVDSQGRLVAQGLEGPAGPQGPQGPAGPAGPEGTQWLTYSSGITTAKNLETPVFTSQPSEIHLWFTSTLASRNHTLEFLTDVGAVATVTPVGRAAYLATTNSFPDLIAPVPITQDPCSNPIVSLSLLRAGSTKYQLRSQSQSRDGHLFIASGILTIGSWRRLRVTSNASGTEWDYQLGYRL